MSKLLRYPMLLDLLNIILLSETEGKNSKQLIEKFLAIEP
jgi:hypothetical protein